MASKPSEAPLASPVTDATAPNAPEYAWQSINSASKNGVHILEEASENGMNIVEPLARTLERAIKDLEHHGDKTVSEVVCVEPLRKLIEEADAIYQDRRKFEVLVGVQGATGAGKTSLLNALLGYRELLPTNSSEAATATACRIEYNYENDPRKAFRAEIAFRSRQEVKEELDRFFKDLQFRRDLRDGKLSEEYDHHNADGGERIGALRAATENIQETFEKIKAVWPNYSITELESMKTADLLKATHPGVKLLGNTFKEENSNAEDFSRGVKSFLDSTRMKVGAGEKDCSASLWPLIKYVKIFVKSAILKHGVVLVDLPGLSDAVESRAAVALSFYNKLAVTIVVTPAGRAADEKTGRNLMDENQELHLRMNDQCDGRYFCVALSKTDEIDWEKFPMQENLVQLIGNIQKIKDLRREIKHLSARYTEAIKQWTALKKTKKENPRAPKKSKTGPDTDMNTVKAEMKPVRKVINRTKKRKIQKSHEVKELTGATIHACLQVRSAKLRDRIVTQLKEKQEAFGLEVPDEAKNRPIQVMPVSTKAFWAVEDKSSVTNPVDGFPSTGYTGIPMLRDWIGDATCQRRERHATALLNRLNSLLANIKTWLSDEGQQNRVKLSRVKVIEKRVNPALRKMRVDLGKYGTLLSKRVQACDPIRKESKIQKVNLCVAKCSELVHRWQFRNPDAPEEQLKRLHWLTHGAIVKRDGAFISKSTGKSYDWMAEQSLQFNKQIAHSWIMTLHREIPSLEGPARDEIDRICKSYIQTMLSNLELDFPDRKSYLSREIAGLNAAKEEIKDKVGEAINQLSTQSNEIHPKLKENVEKEWKPAFIKAAKAKGLGTMTARQLILETHVKKKGKEMYRSSITALEKEIKASQMQFHPVLGRIWDLANERFSRHMELVITNLIKYDGGDDKHVELAETSRAQVQEQIRGFISEWIMVWNTSDIVMEDLDADNNKIPRHYVHTVPLDDDDDDDDQEGDPDNCMTDDSEDDDSDSEDEKMSDIKTEPAACF